MVDYIINRLLIDFYMNSESALRYFVTAKGLKTRKGPISAQGMLKHGIHRSIYFFYSLHIITSFSCVYFFLTFPLNALYVRMWISIFLLLKNLITPRFHMCKPQYLFYHHHHLYFLINFKIAIIFYAPGIICQYFKCQQSRAINEKCMHYTIS